MLGIKLNLYWRVCWRFLTPGLMTVIVVYTLVKFELPKDGNFDYPAVAHIVGWSLAAVSLSQVPIFAVYKIRRGKTNENILKVIIEVELKFFVNFFICFA